MVRPERANWLDKAIAKTVPGEPPQPDFPAWRQAHPEVLEALAQRARANDYSPLRHHAGLPGVIDFGRRIMRSPIGRLAVAAAVVLAVLGGIHYLGGSIDGTSRAFADICRNVTQSSTVRFVTRSATLTAQIYEKDGYLVRTELQAPGPMPFDTILMDKQAGNYLYMDSQRKVAWHPSVEFRHATSSVYELFTNYLQMPDYSVTELGKKHIGGQLSMGFRLTTQDKVLGLLQYDIWTDPKTRLPIQIDFTGTAPDGRALDNVTTDIVFDEPLNDALFDFEPDGFQIIDESDLNTPASEVSPAIEGQQTSRASIQESAPESESTATEVEPNALSQTKAEGTPANPVGAARRPHEQAPADMGVVTYEGTVTDEAGDAVPGVRVWGWALDRTLGCTTLAQETLTGPDGQFRLSTDRPVEGREIYRLLHFDHSDYGMGWRTLSGTNERTQDIQIVLYAPASVAGIVVDHLGRPIADALVEASMKVSVNGRSDHLLLWDLTGMAERTDHEGRFTLSRLPAPASLQLRVSGDGYALYNWRSNSPGGAVRVNAGNDDVRVSLDPGSSIAGQIVYSNGTLYERRAIITIEGPGAHQLIFATDDDGRFISPGLSPGLYRVSAEREPSKSLCMPIDAQVDLSNAVSKITLTVIDEGLPVAVQIVDKHTDKPLEGVLVQAMFGEAGEGAIDHAQTNETGRCILSVPPGQCRIVAQGWKNGQFAEFSETLVLKPKQTDAAVLLAITARPYITGQLIDAHGHPIEGFVQIGSGSQTPTDPNGRFTVEEPFGSVFGLQPSWAYDITTQTAKMFLFNEADYANELLIILEPCVTLTGRIVDSTGRVQLDVGPRLGISVPSGGMVVLHSRAPWNVTVGEDGVFAIEKVPVGLPIWISAERRGLQGEVQLGELSPGQTQDIGDLMLHGVDGIGETTDWTGTLEGTITDESNRPMAGATVRVYTWNDDVEAVTDRYGQYKLGRLPKGIRLNFSLFLPGYGHCHKYVYAEGDDGDMQIFPQGWELLGKQAPPLSIEKWYNSDPLTLEELRGTVVLLQIGVLLPLHGNSLTTMRRMHEKYGERGLETIAIHQPLDVTWGGKVTEADIEKFIAQGNVPFVFCLDRKRETHRAYAPKATPALYLIDRAGCVVISPAEDNLERCIDELLAR